MSRCAQSVLVDPGPNASVAWVRSLHPVCRKEEASLVGFCGRWVELSRVLCGWACYNLGRPTLSIPVCMLYAKVFFIMRDAQALTVRGAIGRTSSAHGLGPTTMTYTLRAYGTPTGGGSLAGLLCCAVPDTRFELHLANFRWTPRGCDVRLDARAWSFRPTAVTLARAPPHHGDTVVLETLLFGGR